MTYEEALHNLNLDESAGPGEIEKAYRRLVRRYPPEFHPDRFRLVEESYQVLTSLAYRIRLLMMQDRGGSQIDVDRFRFEPAVDPGRVQEAVEELRRDALIHFITSCD